LAAGAANIVPARCQQQKWRFCPAKAWLNSCIPPLFSPLPAFFQQEQPFLFTILPFWVLQDFVWIYLSKDIKDLKEQSPTLVTTLKNLQAVRMSQGFNRP